MATKDTKAADEARKVVEAAKEAEAPVAPDEVESGEETGMKALVEDLHDRRRRAKLGGGEQKIALQHERGKLTARERIDLLVDEGTFVELGIHGRPHFSQRSMEGKEAPADGVITGWGDVDGRRCAIAAYDFTVMAGSMGMTGELKVGRLRELALQKRMPLHLAARLGRSAHPGGRRVAVRGLRPPVPRGGDDVGRHPAGGRDARPLRGGNRLHPGAVGLRADGGRPGRDGARGPAPDQGRDRRGHLHGGARRSQGALPQVGGRRPRGRRTTTSASRPSGPTSPTSRPTARRSRRCARPRIPTTGCRRSCSTSFPSHRASPTTCTR